ncbi:MAG TPA: rRNA pseudouridine synthase [Anaerolineae bacterium]|nr:rRNA pseudouridine synthase [Anaerolineae bacterium]
MEERLQKFLAHAGIGSRRSCEKLISDGRVYVNGKKAKLGMKVDISKDKISLDNKIIKGPASNIYIALNKPRGVLSTTKTKENRRTVLDLIPNLGHIYPVGRLDIDSEGLILLTNDGELTNKLTHPRYQHEKEYKVLVSKIPDDKQIKAWKSGIVLLDGHRTIPAKVKILSTHKDKGAWLSVILFEGKKRQIREMGQLTGLYVKRIIRIRIGTLRLGNLKTGSWRFLSEREIHDLKS